MGNIPIIIPAYEPDERIIKLVDDLLEFGKENIVVVNDGSSAQFNDIFDRLKCKGGGKIVVIPHKVNMGKGRALKTAFNYCLTNYSDLVGTVTADSDGQHSASDIYKCVEALKCYRDCLILGSRDFDLPNVPDKSRLGNQITCKVCKYFCGIDISDTQTGLRGIPQKFMETLLNVAGERFEFETNMLIAAKNEFAIKEIPIETIYESKDNHITHFDPIVYHKYFRVSGFEFFSGLSL